jgi:hypothetical protein
VKYPSHYDNYVFIVELLGIMCRRKTGTSIGLIISYGSLDREYERTQGEGMRGGG